MTSNKEVAKENEVWQLVPIRLKCAGDEYNVIQVQDLDYDVDSVAMLRTTTVGQLSREGVGPYVYLTLEDSKSLRAYLEMCEENYETRFRD